jgi:hypothetical protein
LKTKFMIKWECWDLGETKEFLGMSICWDRKNRIIYINQMNYLEKILKRFNITTKPTKTPLQSRFTFLPNTETASLPFKRLYQQLVGSLMYLMIGSRPDIAYTTVKLSQQCANPSKVHYNQGLYLMWYLLGTRQYQLWFNGSSNESIIAYSDSD